MRTKEGTLALVGKDVEKNDLVCILYGCSVPVILRESRKKTEPEFLGEMEQELKDVKTTVVQNFQRYMLRKRRHEARKDSGMVPLCRQWFKTADYLHTHGFVPRKLTVEATKEELLSILKAALEAFSVWRRRERLKQWPDQERRMMQELSDAKLKKSKPGKKQMDELLQKQTKKDLEALAQRKRRKSRSAGDLLDLAPATTSSLGGAGTGASKDASTTAKKKKPVIDWWAFEYALAAGRRWRQIVRERKVSRSAYALERTQDEWIKQQRDDYHNFKEWRQREGKWVEVKQPADKKEPSTEATATKKTGKSKSALPNPLDQKVRPSWARRKNIDVLTPEEEVEYDAKIRSNLRESLGEEGYFSYKLLGECYIHGFMDGEAMLYQNEGDDEVIPSMIFEIR